MGVHCGPPLESAFSSFACWHATCPADTMTITDYRGAGVVSVATALPRHRFEQRDLAHLAQEVIPELGANERQLSRFFQRVSVHHRHLALNREAYAHLGGMQSRSRAWLEVGLELGERCVSDLLRRAGMSADEIRCLMTTTVTGLSVPTLDARLMNRIAFPTHLKRLPSFGLGCVGGAVGVARIADYLRAFPDQAAILLSVELCSLTVQKADLSLANLIAMGLFGDGAAAVLMVGRQHPAWVESRLRVVDSLSVFFPNTERAMGWDVVDTGFKVVLDQRVPELARTELRPRVDELLSQHGLSRKDVAAWVCHPGGPRILDAISEGLELDPAALAPARQTLENIGNLSSASVLFLLEEFCGARKPAPGKWGIMLAMGPGFCAEIVLLRW